MRMIVLILGWHLALLGAITICSDLIYGVALLPMVFGVGFFVIGLAISIFLRKAVSASAPEPINKPEVPLDYY